MEFKRLIIIVKALSQPSIRTLLSVKYVTKLTPLQRVARPSRNLVEDYLRTRLTKVTGTLRGMGSTQNG